MTVTTDLQQATGVVRVLYLTIDGMEPAFFQRNAKGAPTGWSRSTKVCLHAPEEQSMELDLGEMTSDLSAMSFALDDIKDADGTSYFGKLFASGRWNSNPHVRMSMASDYQTYVNAVATTIPIQSNIGFPGAGNAYIGQESISYTSQNVSSIINATRGLYSSINVLQPWGHTYEQPKNSDSAYSYAISTVPYSHLGRRVALWVTTWDRTTGAFRAESESVLLWTGRISDQIIQTGRTGVWEISCKSIMQELDRDIPAGEFPSTYLRKINCMGPRGLSFRVDYFDNNGELRCYAIIKVDPDWYEPDDLINFLNNALWYAGWIDVHKPTNYPKMGMSGGGSTIRGGTSGDAKVTLWCRTGWDEGPGMFVFRPSWNGETCHPLNALGFRSRAAIHILASTSQNDGHYYQGEEEGEENFFYDYHPLHQDHNSGWVMVEEETKLWADQGDDPGMSQASVYMEDATLAPFWSLAVDSGNYFARYINRLDGSGYGHGDAGLLQLTTDPAPVVSRDGYVGNRFGDDFTEVRQCYIPKYLQASGNKKGPFELLLTPLLSTGTQSYNGTYDRAPLALGLGIQKELVDINSFLRADKHAMTSFLANRVIYPIMEPISMSELFSRECKLFGYVPVWRKGKITLSPVLHPDTGAWTAHLSDSTMAKPDEWPDISMSSSTVVNRYKLKIVYSYTEDEYGAPYIVTDVDSLLGIEPKEVEIEHPGICLSSTVKNIKEAVRLLVGGRFIRFPLPVLDVSLAPVMSHRVFQGDLVKFTSSRIQDPFGGGTRVTTTYGIVLRVSWNYQTWVGSCKIMLLDASPAAAWAPAAVVNRSASGANAGYYSSSNSLALTAHQWSNTDHPEDGNAVSEVAGWKVVVLDRCPVDPASPTIHGPYTALAYHMSNHVLQLNEGITGWDNTTAHVVTFADWSDINADQYTDSKGTWQADSASELLGGDTKPQRYT